MTREDSTLLSRCLLPRRAEQVLMGLDLSFLGSAWAVIRAVVGSGACIASFRQTMWMAQRAERRQGRKYHHYEARHNGISPACIKISLLYCTRESVVKGWSWDAPLLALQEGLIYGPHTIASPGQWSGWIRGVYESPQVSSYSIFIQRISIHMHLSPQMGRGGV